MMRSASQRGLGLIDLMATLVIICGVIAATMYYRGRPVDDPKSVDASLPAFISSPSPGTNYYLEGRVTGLMRNEAGVYYKVTTSDAKYFWVVGAKGTSGGIDNVAPGQVGMMQVQANAGPNQRTSFSVISASQVADGFVYKYMVKSPAPAGFVDPDAEKEDEVAAAPADPTAPRPPAKDKDDD